MRRNWLARTVLTAAAISVPMAGVVQAAQAAPQSSGQQKAAAHTVQKNTTVVKKKKKKAANRHIAGDRQMVDWSRQFFFICHHGQLRHA